MKLLILAGGEGRRLLPLTKYHHKVMSSVHGKPFLHYLLQLYQKHDIVLSLGYRKDDIKNWCKEYNIWLECAEELTPLGHSGAILNAKQFLSSGKIFAVVNGDTYHDINLNSVKLGFANNKNFVAMQVFANNVLTGKPDCAGIYIFKQECFKYFREGMHTDEILKCIPTSKIYLKDKNYLDIGTHEGLRYAKKTKFLKET